ncbi:MAG: hypothetical protein M1113_03400 [Candidatus Thermoplasmatota archaeon]|nr:hypothetical protein [Candidatus Thermoplasmatota archaeon]
MNIALFRLDNVRPKFTSLDDIKEKTNLRFLLLINDKEKWISGEPLKRDIVTERNEGLKDRLNAAGIFDYKIENKILWSAIHDMNSIFYDKLTEIRSCRVDPNNIWFSGGLYFAIEYEEENNSQVSNVILDYLEEEANFGKELLFMGPYSEDIPFMLDLYHKFGGSLDEFTHMRSKFSLLQDAEDRNRSGIMSNKGEIRIKRLSPENKATIIFHKYSVSPVQHNQAELFEKNEEFLVDSPFFTALHQFIVNSGLVPVFFKAIPEGNAIIADFIVRKDHSNRLLSNLDNLLSSESRVKPSACLESVESL